LETPENDATFTKYGKQIQHFVSFLTDVGLSNATGNTKYTKSQLSELRYTFKSKDYIATCQDSPVTHNNETE
jgi:hypothetical protein